MITHVTLNGDLVPQEITLEVQGPFLGCEDSALLAQFLQENDFTVTLSIDPIETAPTP